MNCNSNWKRWTVKWEWKIQETGRISMFRIDCSGRIATWLNCQKLLSNKKKKKNLGKKDLKWMCWLLDLFRDSDRTGLGMFRLLEGSSYQRYVGPQLDVTRRRQILPRMLRKSPTSNYFPFIPLQLMSLLLLSMSMLSLFLPRHVIPILNHFFFTILIIYNC